MRRLIFMVVSGALIAAVLAIGGVGSAFGAGKLECEQDPEDPDWFICSGGPADPDRQNEVCTTNPGQDVTRCRTVGGGGGGPGHTTVEDGIKTSTGGGGGGGVTSRGVICQTDPATGEPTFCRPYMGGSGGGFGGRTVEKKVGTLEKEGKTEDIYEEISSSGGGGGGGGVTAPVVKGTGAPPDGPQGSGGGSGGRCTVESGCVGKATEE